MDISSVKLQSEKCLKIWGNAKEKRAIKEQTIQSRRLQHQIETVQTLKPMSQSLLGEINPSASNHVKTDRAVGFSWLFWHVLPDGLTFVGASIIVATGLWLLRLERNAHIQAKRQVGRPK